MHGQEALLRNICARISDAFLIPRGTVRGRAGFLPRFCLIKRRPVLQHICRLCLRGDCSLRHGLCLQRQAKCWPRALIHRQLC